MLYTKKQMLYQLLCLICASSLPFLFTLHGDFVFDDSEAIVRNKDVSSESWIDPFYNDFWGTNIKSNLSHKSYRPLTMLTFRMNYLLNNRKLSAVQFKITNLVCHVICCIIVWKTFESILHNLGTRHRKRLGSTAFLAALLFAVHPIHVEAICGIVGRADVLAAITFFLAFLSYTKAAKNPRRNYIYLFTTIILAAISMLFKENGVSVLGVCLCYEMVTNLKQKITESNNIKRKKPSCKESYYYLELKSKIRLTVVTIAVIVLLCGRWAVMGQKKPEFKVTDNPAAFSNNILTRVLTYNYIYFLNLLLLLWPQWLCYDWSMGCIPLIESLQDNRIQWIIFMYLYVILVIVMILNRRNKTPTKRLMIVMVSLIAIPFLPAANIFFPVGFVIAERILYIPSAGYCLLVTVGLNKIVNKVIRYKLFNFFILSPLILIFAVRSWQRSHEWQTEYQLFVSGAVVCPLNAKVHYNIAKVADARHQMQWALVEYRESLRLYPDYYQAMNNLANLLKGYKQYRDAELYLRSAINLKRDFPAAWMNLGILLATTDRLEEAERAYKTALEYRKNYPDCLYNMGNLYRDMNKPEKAKEKWFKVISLNPKHVLAWSNLFVVLDNTDQIETALLLVPMALEALPEEPAVNFAVANVYGRLDRYEDAEQLFLKAIRLFGDKVQSIHYANLGVLYHRWKKYDLAEGMYRSALNIDPSSTSAHRNLVSLQKLKINKIDFNWLCILFSLLFKRKDHVEVACKILIQNVSYSPVFSFKTGSFFYCFSIIGTIKKSVPVCFAF